MNEALLPRCIMEEIAERIKERQSEWANNYARNIKGLGVIYADDTKRIAEVQYNRAREEGED